ncbi:RING finger protein narya [Drosophila grimshawi]|nr:RING finger protein narya [Drosophila grimshawi]
MANRKLKMQGYIKLDAQLRQQNDLEKKRIEELRNYIDYHEKRTDPTNSADMFRSSRRVCRPRTPSSLSVSDTTLTTDNDDVLKKSPNLKQFKQMLSQTVKSELKKV